MRLKRLYRKCVKKPSWLYVVAAVIGGLGSVFLIQYLVRRCRGDPIEPPESNAEKAHATEKKSDSNLSPPKKNPKPNSPLPKNKPEPKKRKSTPSGQPGSKPPSSPKPDDQQQSVSDSNSSSNSPAGHKSNGNKSSGYKSNGNKSSKSSNKSTNKSKGMKSSGGASKKSAKNSSEDSTDSLDEGNVPMTKAPNMSYYMPYPPHLNHPIPPQHAAFQQFQYPPQMPYHPYGVQPFNGNLAYHPQMTPAPRPLAISA